MLIPAHSLLSRIRQPRSRTAEIAAVRRRFVAVAGSGGHEERRLASKLRDLRRELSESLGALRSCSTCSRGCALPEGRWDGGHCCSGQTASLFDDSEVAALALGGTKPRNLVGPRSDHAGCAFRGPTGCSLDVVDRPNRCVLYLCNGATREVFARGELDRFEQLATVMSETFAQFTAARSNRELDELAGLG